MFYDHYETYQEAIRDHVRREDCRFVCMRNVLMDIVTFDNHRYFVVVYHVHGVHGPADGAALAACLTAEHFVQAWEFPEERLQFAFVMMHVRLHMEGTGEPAH